jgi:hypothetical protein
MATDGQTDGQAHMTKLVVACHNLVSMPAKGAVRINSMKAQRRHSSIIHNLGARRRRVVSLMLWPLYFGGNSPRYTPQRTDRPHSRPGRFEEQNNILQIQMYSCQVYYTKDSLPNRHNSKWGETALGNWPTWCTITLYNEFIIRILYMFRATLCSSSGGQVILIQNLV